MGTGVGLWINPFFACIFAVCNEIDQWPGPAPGQTLNLPVMGVVIQVLTAASALKSPSPSAKAGWEGLLHVFCHWVGMFAGASVFSFSLIIES